MVQFQNNLENARLPEWAPQYLNYSLLKLKLKDIIAVKGNPDLEQVCQARQCIFQGTARLKSVSIDIVQPTQSHFTLLSCHARRHIGW